MKLHKDILYSVGDEIEIDNIKYTIELAGWGKIRLHKKCCGDMSAVKEVDDVTAIRGLDIIIALNEEGATEEVEEIKNNLECHFNEIECKFKSEESNLNDKIRILEAQNKDLKNELEDDKSWWIW
mgnify:FL=1